MTIQRQKVKSSQIAAIGFSPETNELDIEFVNHSKTPRPPSVYRYRNVTAKQHADFIAAESIGKHFGANFKNNAAQHPFKKLDAAEAAQEEAK